MIDNGVSAIVWSTKVDVTFFFGLKRGFLLGIQALSFTPVSEELFAAQWRIGSQSVISEALDSFQNDLDIYDVEVKSTDSTVDPDNAYAKATSDYLVCGRWPWGKFSTIPGNAYSWSIILHMLNAETDVDAAHAAIFTALPDTIDSINEKWGSQSFDQADCANCFIDVDAPFVTNAAFPNKDGYDDGLTRTNIL